MRGKIAQDADLDDLMDLLDALEEIGEGEEMGGEVEDRGRRRGRDQEGPLGRERNLEDPDYEEAEPERSTLDTDPNGFGGPGGSPESAGWNTANLEGPSSMYNQSPLDATDEEDPWEAEGNRRSALAKSGSKSIDERIRFNRDAKRRAGDTRKAIIADMRKTIAKAMSAGDAEVPGYNSGVQYNGQQQERSRIPPDAQDRRPVTGDAALDARGRMLANARRITNTGVAYSPANIGSSSPAVGGGSPRSFTSRYPWANRIKLG
jgi:hypothetical protein